MSDSLVSHQPDYENFPEGEFYDQKRDTIERIESNWNMNIVSPDDFEYVLEKSRQFWSLFHYANELRIRLDTDLLEKEIEIEVLKSLLKEAQENGN